jgi:hypothetical protein
MHGPGLDQHFSASASSALENLLFAICIWHGMIHNTRVRAFNRESFSYARSDLLKMSSWFRNEVQVVVLFIGAGEGNLIGREL